MASTYSIGGMGLVSRGFHEHFGGDCTEREKGQEAVGLGIKKPPKLMWIKNTENSWKNVPMFSKY
jgi:hypothetical protein